MKKTNILFAQNIGKMFRDHWRVQRKRIVRPTNAISNLKGMGHTVLDACEVIKENVPWDLRVPLPVVSELKTDEKLANNDIPCLMFKDNNVLLEGLEQAKVFTNTVEIEQGILPPLLQKFCFVDDLPFIDKWVRRAIKSSILFDAEQKKLPKRSDPERPAWNFPRDYGITDHRRNFLLCKRLIQLCASVSPELFTERRILNNGFFSVPLIKDDKNVLLSLRGDLIVTSIKPLKPFESPKNTVGINLPNIEPLLPTVSLEKENISKIEDIYPLHEGIKAPYIQLAMVHYNETEVANLYETEVTESQFLGRSLMKSYAFAVAQARYLFGKDVIDPPSPVVIQCIHTNSKYFQFSVFQLNTLAENTEIHNIFWYLPKINLYETCDYIIGKPVLEGYNPDVFKLLIGFYRYNL